MFFRAAKIGKYCGKSGIILLFTIICGFFVVRSSLLLTGPVIAIVAILFL